MKYNPMPTWAMKFDDGSVVNIRPITLQDIDLEIAFFNELSQKSKHYRFLGGASELSSKTLTDLCNIDYIHDMAFIAVANSGDNEKIVGVVRYAANSGGSKNAEIAISVADDWQNKGIGIELLKKLIDFARLAGIKNLYSIDKYANDKMKLLADEMYFSSKNNPDNASQVNYEL